MSTSHATKNILITGATGFVASNLVRALQTGSDNICMVIRPGNKHFTANDNAVGNVKILYGELADIKFLKQSINENNINIIYHLAANNNNLNANNVYEIYESNIRGTYSLLDACRNLDSIKLIVFSSSEEVSGVLQNFDCETSPNAYMISKATCELIIKNHCFNTGQNIATVRMSNLYGGGDLNFNRLIPSLFRAILNAETIQLRSDGSHMRDYLYVGDAIEAYKKITDSYLSEFISGHHLFQLASESRVSTLDVIEKIKKLCLPQNNSLALSHSESVIKERVGVEYDLSSQNKIINWKSQTSLEHGLHQTYLWYKKYFLTN